MRAVAPRRTESGVVAVHYRDLTRIVVAIDPATTSEERSHETGIVVAGKDAYDRGFVLADLSEKNSPDGWCKTAIKAYHDFGADRIVAETNNGGDLVEALLRTHDKLIPYQKVHAARGKIARAEPVAALYEQQRVFHCGIFLELENEMTSYEAGRPSPNHLDALVWAMTFLLIGVRRRFGAAAGGKRTVIKLAGMR